MVNNLIFRATDTDTALERVQKSLGPNAYIIEIKNVGNFVEITASLEEPVSRPKKIASKAEKTPTPTVDNSQSFDKNSNYYKANNIDQNNSKASNIFISPEQLKATDQSQERELPLESLSTAIIDGTGPNAASKSTFASSKISEEPPVDLRLSTNSKNLVATTTNSLKLDQFSSGAKKVKKQSDDNRKSIELGFGDLLNLGMSSDFIKKTFSIGEFEGGISKVQLINSLINSLYDPFGNSVFENQSNLMFLGPPGSGKSTICAKLMHYFGTQYSTKPAVVHVTPEKLFEADRLNFYAKMFNFPFIRCHSTDIGSMPADKGSLIEVAWDFQANFAHLYSGNSSSFSNFKLFLVLPAEINNETLKQIIRVCPNIKSVILNKCDYGRFSIKNLMLLFQKGYNIFILSGDRSVSSRLKEADEDMMREFIEYTLKF